MSPKVLLCMDNMKYKHSQKGAILLTVLIVMVMLVLLVSASNSIISKRLDSAKQGKSLVVKKALVNGKINEIAYLAATQRFTRAGISTGKNKEKLIRNDGQWAFSITGDEMRVDGTKMSQDSDEYTLDYQIQAENGLIPINTGSAFWQNKWLLSYDINYTQMQKYIDTLHDYIDADSNIRAAGAENRSYESSRTYSLPTNYFIQDCSELSLIINWSDLVENNRSIINECSTELSSSLNINAIPKPLLQRLWPEKSAQILNKRNRNEWFVNIDDLGFVINDLDLNNELLYRFSMNDSIIVSASTGGYSETRKIELGAGFTQPFSFHSSSFNASSN